jgi:hypothetical protein
MGQTGSARQANGGHMRFLGRMPDNPWPQDMAIRVDDAPHHVAVLLFIRPARGLRPTPRFPGSTRCRKSAPRACRTPRESEWEQRCSPHAYAPPAGARRSHTSPGACRPSSLPGRAAWTLSLCFPMRGSSPAASPSVIWPYPLPPATIRRATAGRSEQQWVPAKCLGPTAPETAARGSPAAGPVRCVTPDPGWPAGWQASLYCKDFAGPSTACPLVIGHPLG